MEDLSQPLAQKVVDSTTTSTLESTFSYNFIMFGHCQLNKPLQCYHIGYLGCKSITEASSGIEFASYKIEFDDAEPIIIGNTILVSA